MDMSQAQSSVMKPRALRARVEGTLRGGDEALSSWPYGANTSRPFRNFSRARWCQTKFKEQFGPLFKWQRPCLPRQ